MADLKGWSFDKHADGVIVCTKADPTGKPIMGSIAREDDDNIARAVLWELANDLLATDGVQGGSHG